MKLTWTTEKRKVKELKPASFNPRTWKKNGKTQLDESLDKFDLVEIPVANRDNGLIAGHRRIERLIVRGEGERMIDVRIPNRMLTEEELKEYMIRSNNHQAGWNNAVLEAEFIKIVDLANAGMEQSVLDALGIMPDFVDAKEDDFNNKLPEHAQSVEGDLYELVSVEKGLKHRVVCGDSTQADVVKKVLECIKPKLMATDPPYGVGYDPTWRNNDAPSMKSNRKVKSRTKVKNDDQASWKMTYSLYRGDVAYVWHAGKHASTVQRDLEECGFEIISQIIWAKTNGAISRGDYHWKHEPCWYAVRKGKKHNWQGARDQWTVWTIKNLSARSMIESEGVTGHGTQKPIECMARPIINNTKIGDEVYDPFLGSGTTLIACEQLKRTCYGIELDPRHVDMIVKRWVRQMNKEGKKYQVLLNGSPIAEEKLNLICQVESK